MKIINDGDLALIIHRDRRYLKRLTADKGFHGRGGTLQYSDIIGKKFGIRFGEYDIFEPSLEDIVMYGFSRETQIVYPKDASFILFKLGIKPGSRIVEIGTGSGVLTYLFSRFAGPEGKVVTIEKEERHFKNARKNIERFRDWDNIELNNIDVVDWQGNGFDGAFIDVREPWLYLERVSGFLKGSGLLGIIVPTANQIGETLKEIEHYFGDVEVIEIMLRKYKTVSERVRPFDRMVAHTGYLIFGRKIDIRPPN